MIYGLNESTCSVACCMWKEMAVVFIIIMILGGCSSDFSRFAEEVTEKKVPSYRFAQQKAEVQPELISFTIPHHTTHEISMNRDIPPVTSSTLMSPIQNGDHDLSNLSSFHPLPQKKLLGTLPGSEASQVQQHVKNTKKNINYAVQKGDTLFAISRNYNTTVDDLKAANNLNGDLIRIGQFLTVPCCNLPIKEHNYTSLMKYGQENVNISSLKEDTAKSVHSSDETEQHSDVKFYQKEEENSSFVKPIATEEQKKISRENLANNFKLHWPVKGRILNHYGQQNGTSTNEGMDIDVPAGTPVQASESGIVIYADDGLKEFGKTVLIRHNNAFVTVYGHNSVILVKRGQQIQSGENIALSGMSGNVSTPQLHFEVRHGSKPVNPLSYLES